MSAGIRIVCSFHVKFLHLSYNLVNVKYVPNNPIQKILTHRENLNAWKQFLFTFRGHHVKKCFEKKDVLKTVVKNLDRYIKFSDLFITLSSCKWASSSYFFIKYLLRSKTIGASYVFFVWLKHYLSIFTDTFTTAGEIFF